MQRNTLNLSFFSSSLTHGISCMLYWCYNSCNANMLCCRCPLVRPTTGDIRSTPCTNIFSLIYNLIGRDTPMMRKTLFDGEWTQLSYIHIHTVLQSNTTIPLPYQHPTSLTKSFLARFRFTSQSPYPFLWL